ncbi:MAG: hypothetical protein NTV93_02435 [Verrucomicrobia bacterium]|nr:hypothetical protein [Verrucomicrobiota bacterium]
MTTALQDNPPSQKKRIRRIIITVVLISIGIHIAAGIVAGVVIVARYLSEPPAEFKATRDIRLPARQREHKMNMASFDGMAPKPSFNDKMQSIRPTAFALPELPKMDMDQMLPLDPGEIVSDQTSSLAGTGGLGTGMGTGGSGGGGFGGGTGMSFFGIQSTGKRILLIFDVSTSVVNKASAAGMPLSKIQEETSDLISKLPISARFGIIQFTQNYKPFNKELVPATDQNRAAALEWIKTEWVETGTMGASGKVASNPRGLVGVLEIAAKMQPDVIFLISDASFQWKAAGPIENIPWKEIEKVTEGPLQGAEGCKIHFIGFEMKPDDKREFSAIVRKSGGKIREIK